MADVKISQLPAATTPLAGTEQIPLVQSATTKQVTVSNLLTAANLGTPTAINLTNATNVPVNQATGILPVANGGSGTATPSIVGGTNISVSGTWPNQTISATGAASGNVTGPVSSTDNAVVRFDNTTGQVIQNSGVIINDSDEISGGTWKGTAIEVAYGGTGTTNPSLVAGTNVTISGTWPNQTINSTASGGVTSVTGTAPVVSSGGSTPAISMAAANTSTSGYLTSTDWNTFNNKQPAGSYLTSGGALGTPSSGTATNLTGLPLSTGVTGTLPVANGGTGTTTPSLVAGTNVTITGTWPNQTINSTGGGGGGSGTVTDVSIVSANGLAGTVATSTTTPAITLSTSVSGMVKGNGTALSAATAGTDYVAPGGALGTPSSGTLTNTTGLPISTGVSGLGTGVATALAVNVGTAGAPVINGGVLGTPSSGTLTNATGLPISTGVSGLGTGVATALAVAVGSAGAPVVNGGALGTPSSGTLTNATGLPISTGVSGLGTGVATFLATPSSANLASAVTDETGSGALVFATSPTLVTPVLGTPTSGNFSTGSFTWPTFNQNTTGTAAGLSATLAVASGGTGQTSYTDGQLLIGNSTGNTLTKATLTAGSGISVTNASGSITIAATGGGGGTSIGLVRALAVNCILC